MSRVFNPQRLDVAAFSQAKAELSGSEPVQHMPRLAAELHGSPEEVAIDWQATGRSMRAVDGAFYPAIHLEAQAVLPLACQMCMNEALVPIRIDRRVLFVEGEEAAAALDDQSEEDVLALASDFNLKELLEDEILMALPLVPRHEQCPEAPVTSVEDPEFHQAMDEKPKPFAALAALKGAKKDT